MPSPALTVHLSGGRRSSSRRPLRSVRRSARRNPGNRRSVVLVVAALLAAMSWSRDQGSLSADASCRLPGSAISITPEQATNAALVAGVGWDRGLPDRAVAIALATAQQESGLRNIHHGDRDSLGLFQQRPSQGWGTEAQVTDPLYAAGTFYDRLVQVPGWESGRLTDVAQAVQRSGFPEAYQKHEVMAVDLTAALRAGDRRIDCH